MKEALKDLVGKLPKYPMVVHDSLGKSVPLPIDEKILLLKKRTFKKRNRMGKS